MLKSHLLIIILIADLQSCTYNKNTFQ